jgi:hypothetical protein
MSAAVLNLQFNMALIWLWDGLKLSHARMRYSSNPGLPRAITIDKGADSEHNKL